MGIVFSVSSDLGRALLGFLASAEDSSETVADSGVSPTTSVEPSESSIAVGNEVFVSLTAVVTTSALPSF